MQCRAEGSSGATAALSSLAVDEEKGTDGFVEDDEEAIGVSFSLPDEEREERDLFRLSRPLKGLNGTRCKVDGSWCGIIKSCGDVNGSSLVDGSVIVDEDV